MRGSIVFDAKNPAQVAFPLNSRLFGNKKFLETRASKKQLIASLALLAKLKSNYSLN